MNTNKSDLQNAEQDGSQKCRLLVIGAQVAEMLRDHDLFGDQFEVVGQFADLEQWSNAPEADQSSDLLIVESPSLFPETIELINSRVRATGALRAIVIYHFSQEATEEMMAKHASGITGMRAPVSPGDLKLACEADLAMVAIRNSPTAEIIESADVTNPAPDSEDHEIPDRRFTDDQLTKISQISTTIDCECPHHMTSLLASLNAFEQYSRECESKSEKDVVLHAYLHRRTAHARSIMEDALLTLAEAEGFDLP